MKTSSTSSPSRNGDAPLESTSETTMLRYPPPPGAATAATSNTSHFVLSSGSRIVILPIAGPGASSNASSSAATARPAGSCASARITVAAFCVTDPAAAYLGRGRRPRWRSRRRIDRRRAARQVHEDRGGTAREVKRVDRLRVGIRVGRPAVDHAVDRAGGADEELVVGTPADQVLDRREADVHSAATDVQRERPRVDAADVPLVRGVSGLERIGTSPAVDRTAQRTALGDRECVARAAADEALDAAERGDVKGALAGP